MDFVSSLAWHEFVQVMLRCIFVLAGIGCVWSTHVEMHFVSLLAWGEFIYKNFTKNLFETNFFEEIFLQQKMSTRKFSVLARMRCVWSSQVKIKFVSMLAWDGFGQHMVRFILCPRWYGRCLVNTR